MGIHSAISRKYNTYRFRQQTKELIGTGATYDYNLLKDSINDGSLFRLYDLYNDENKARYYPTSNVKAEGALLGYGMGPLRMLGGFALGGFERMIGTHHEMRDVAKGLADINKEYNRQNETLTAKDAATIIDQYQTTAARRTLEGLVCELGYVKNAKASDVEKESLTKGLANVPDFYKGLAQEGLMLGAAAGVSSQSLSFPVVYGVYKLTQILSRTLSEMMGDGVRLASKTYTDKEDGWKNGAELAGTLTGLATFSTVAGLATTGAIAFAPTTALLALGAYATYMGKRRRQQARCTRYGLEDALANKNDVDVNSNTKVIDTMLRSARRYEKASSVLKLLSLTALIGGFAYKAGHLHFSHSNSNSDTPSGDSSSSQSNAPAEQGGSQSGASAGQGGSQEVKTTASAVQNNTAATPTGTTQCAITYNTNTLSSNPINESFAAHGTWINGHYVGGANHELGITLDDDLSRGNVAIVRTDFHTTNLAADRTVIMVEGWNNNGQTYQGFVDVKPDGSFDLSHLKFDGFSKYEITWEKVTEISDDCNTYSLEALSSVRHGFGIHEHTTNQDITTETAQTTNNGQAGQVSQNVPATHNETPSHTLRLDLYRPTYGFSFDSLDHPMTLKVDGDYYNGVTNMPGNTFFWFNGNVQGTHHLNYHLTDGSLNAVQERTFTSDTLNSVNVSEQITIDLNTAGRLVRPSASVNTLVDLPETLPIIPNNEEVLSHPEQGIHLEGSKSIEIEMPPLSDASDITYQPFAKNTFFGSRIINDDISRIIEEQRVFEEMIRRLFENGELV